MPSWICNPAGMLTCLGSKHGVFSRGRSLKAVKPYEAKSSKPCCSRDNLEVIPTHSSLLTLRSITTSYCFLLSENLLLSILLSPPLSVPQPTSSSSLPAIFFYSSLIATMTKNCVDCIIFLSGEKSQNLKIKYELLSIVYMVWTLIAFPPVLSPVSHDLCVFPLLNRKFPDPSSGSSHWLYIGIEWRILNIESLARYYTTYLIMTYPSIFQKPFLEEAASVVTYFHSILYFLTKPIPNITSNCNYFFNPCFSVRG